MLCEKQQSCVRGGNALGRDQGGWRRRSYCRGGAGGRRNPGNPSLAPAPALAVPRSSGLHVMGGGGATTLQADLMAAGGLGRECHVHTRSANWCPQVCSGSFMCLPLVSLAVDVSAASHLASKTGIRKGFGGHRQTPLLPRGHPASLLLSPDYAASKSINKFQLHST